MMSAGRAWLGGERLRVLVAAIVGVPLACAGLGTPAEASATVGATLAVYSGTGSYAAITPGPAGTSALSYPYTLATDPSGNLYTTFSSGSGDQYSIAKIDTSAHIGYFVNSGHTSGMPAVGTALASPTQGVYGIAADASGNVYFSDASRHVSKVNPAGMLSLFAGNGTDGTMAPGPALSSPMAPKALAAGADGSVYLANDNTVAKVDTSGMLSIIAGGDDGIETTTPGTPATSSLFGGIVGLADDSAGDVFSSDGGNSCVTLVDATTGYLTSVVGTCGMSGPALTGPASLSHLTTPRQIAVDRHDNLYIADNGNSRVERVTAPASGSGLLTTIAGNGTSGSMADGPATAPLSSITGLAVDRWMNIYVSQGSGTYLGRIAAAPSAPDAPGTPMLTPGDGQLNLTFGVPDDDGGSPVTRYQYSLDGGSNWLPASGTWPASTSGATVTGLISGLTNGQGYSVKVRAHNEIGDSPASDAANGAPAIVWFTDPVSAPDRAREVAVPAHPARYHGRRVYTRALNRAYHSQIAVPIPMIHGRTLIAGQAATLAASGLFRFNSAVLTPSGHRQVTALVASLAATASITCEGYADYGARIGWETSLSLARARAVCSALTRGGVHAQKTTVGYGPRRPVVIGGPRAQRAANRRVVVLVKAVAVIG